MPIVKLLLLLLLFLQEKKCFGTSDISTTEFKHVAQLHDKYSLQWNFNSTHIIFRAQAQTQGYMSFGLSIKGGMYDSDIFVCTHRNTCTIAMPKVDDSQDYDLFIDSTNGTHRTIIFGRKLQTKDNNDIDITVSMRRKFAFNVCFINLFIQPGNERYVHHMILYSCTRGSKELHNKEHRCYNRNMPNDFWSCVGIIVAWAVGGQSFVYPKNVGYSLGTPDDPKFVLLEIHYDNPERKTGVVDSSGFKLFYTPELRKIDSGIIELGADPSNLQIIPPRASAFRVYGICPTQNFGDGENDVIYAFASLLHSHLAGIAIRLRKISSTSIAYEELIYYFCTFYICGRNVMCALQGGFHTEQEMCLAYLHYYPRVGLARCRSIYNTTEMITVWKPPIYFLNNLLEGVLSLKLLGLTICHDLFWESHISNLASKPSHRLGILHRTKSFLGPPELLTTYKAFVCSLMEDCSPHLGWCSCLSPFSASRCGNKGI
uniref:DOMON domain-containing protein n=1 Tax=Eptatretus burgeri TaxID=7764 RepID=A0A8C4QRG2_EPTBU